MTSNHDQSPLSPLRRLPSVDTLVGHADLALAIREQGRPAVVDAVRCVLDKHRNRLVSCEANAEPPDESTLVHETVRRLTLATRPIVQPVINATGVLLHTGLGRAPMATEAVEAAARAAAQYGSVELDLEAGARTQRSRALEALLGQLLGAEAAMVVNNNAAATALTVAALATGREVIVSHGELIEIGGGYRLPEVITGFGAELRPVGTTNKTRLSDYARAIGDRTGAILVVHPSNYVVQGFTAKPSVAALAELARARDVPLVHDIGSGALVDVAPFGCAGEPLAAQSLREGVDLVLFSGDKLLGGPQSGIVVGRRDLVEKADRHPMSRAVRIDKMTLAALEVTLRIYLAPDRASERVPLLRMLAQGSDGLRSRAQTLVEGLREARPQLEIDVVPDEAYAGGGSAPGQALASWSVAVRPAKDDSVDALASRLRQGRPPVLGRVRNDRLLVNLHTVFPEQDATLAGALETATGHSN